MAKCPKCKHDLIVFKVDGDIRAYCKKCEWEICDSEATKNFQWEWFNVVGRCLADEYNKIDATIGADMPDYPE